MVEDGGFFEELHDDDVEELELSASEEEFEDVQSFKESATYQEIDGIIKEVEEEEVGNGNDPVYSSEDLSSDFLQDGNVRIVYVYKQSLQNNEKSVSDNQIFVLDPKQFDLLINEIVDSKYSEPQTVSMNDYSEDFKQLLEYQQGNFIINVILFGLVFGYFVKESIFRYF